MHWWRRSINSRSISENESRYEMNARENFERDLDFSGADFERIRKLIYSSAGIALNDSKQQMAYSRLSRRVRATGAGSFH
ncbi:MAG: hypothetical protein ACK5RH_09150, partial [Burkholderiales bacterium]